MHAGRHSLAQGFERRPSTCQRRRVLGLARGQPILQLRRARVRPRQRLAAGRQRLLQLAGALQERTHLRTNTPPWSRSLCMEKLL